MAIPATATANSSVTIAIPASVPAPTSFNLRVNLQNVNSPTAVTPLIRTTYTTNDASSPQICFNALVTTCSTGNLDNLGRAQQRR